MIDKGKNVASVVLSKLALRIQKLLPQKKYFVLTEEQIAKQKDEHARELAEFWAKKQPKIR